MNMQNRGYSAKLQLETVATDAPRLPRHHFSKRCQVADIKNIAGDDQATPMVYRNSANIAYTFRFYV